MWHAFNAVFFLYNNKPFWKTYFLIFYLHDLHMYIALLVHVSTEKMKMVNTLFNLLTYTSKYGKHSKSIAEAVSLNGHIYLKP